MLKTALEFVQDELNSYIQKRDPVNFGSKDLAVLSNIVTQDGNFAFDDPNTAGEHAIIITLVNIEESRIAECQNYFHKKADGTILKGNPAVNLEFFVLFTAYSDDYNSSLRNLTFITNFFQTHNVFTPEKFPHLNSHADSDKPWQKVEKLLFTHHNLTFEQQNNLWGALGAKYMPSLIYKLRILRFEDDQYQSETPPILEANLLDS